MSNTRFTTLVVGVSTALASGLIAFFAGTLGVRDAVNFTSQTGTQTGAVLQVDGATRFQAYPLTCTATGGLTKYSTCSGRSPFTTTGALLGVSLECGNVATQLTGDYSFKKTRFSNSGTVLTNLDNVVAGTGSTEVSWFATEQKWNPADLLTFTTLVTPTGTLNTIRYDCQSWAYALNKYGS